MVFVMVLECFEIIFLTAGHVSPHHDFGDRHVRGPHLVHRELDDNGNVAEDAVVHASGTIAVVECVVNVAANGVAALTVDSENRVCGVKTSNSNDVRIARLDFNTEAIAYQLGYTVHVPRAERQWGCGKIGRNF